MLILYTSRHFATNWKLYSTNTKNFHLRIVFSEEDFIVHKDIRAHIRVHQNSYACKYTYRKSENLTKTKRIRRFHGVEMCVELDYQFMCKVCNNIVREHLFNSSNFWNHGNRDAVLILEKQKRPSFSLHHLAYQVVIHWGLRV